MKSESSPSHCPSKGRAEVLRKKSGETIRSCTMIITEPNRFVAEVHDRMPALLGPEQFDAWLDGSAGKEVLVPAPEDMLQRRPVSERAPPACFCS